MKENLQLSELAKQVSSEYLKNKIPMNDTLEKVAEKYSLNKEELHRISELANVDVYLQLIDQSEDKYLDFPLADFNLVYNKLVEKNANYKPRNSELYSDVVDDKPFSFQMYKTRSRETGNPNIDKVASFIPINPINEKLNEASRYQTCIKFVENTAFDIKGKIGQLVDDVYFMVKQACLSGTSFNDLKRVIDEYTPTLNDYLIGFCEEKLKNETVRYKEFFKEAQYSDCRINENHKLVKVLKDIEKQANLFYKVATVYEHFVNEYNKLVKEYKVGFEKDANFFKNTFTFFKKHPVLSTSAAVGTSSYLIGKQVGKNLEANKPYTKEQIINRMVGR